MDAVTPKGLGKDVVEGHSHIVRPAEMEWKKTSFPGCEAKPLYVDARTGIATLLMKFDPGAVLPDHEHVMVEQTYVISGKLVDMEGPAEGLTVGALLGGLAGGLAPWIWVLTLVPSSSLSTPVITNSSPGAKPFVTSES